MIAEILGSKAENLRRLEAAGCQVPRFCTISSDDVTPENVSKLISETFTQTEGLYAVRSSACSEDTTAQANAGLFHSELGVGRHDVFSACQWVAASLAAQKTAGSIIIQAFVPSDCAGVIFTHSEPDAYLVIEATNGLCSAVVAGEATDRWLIDDDNSIVSLDQAEEKIIHRWTGAEIAVDVCTDQVAMTAEQVQKVVEEAKRIAVLFGKPQDIEFCWHNSELFILQSRPITVPVRIEKTYYDSANIAESYTGIVLPLTFSFAQQMYQQVYRDLLRESGVPAQDIARHPDVFAGLLSHLFGRMYYNMNNWYRMMHFLPGFNRNKNNLEHMISSNIRVDIPQDIRPSWWLRVRYPFLVIWKILRFHRTVAQFELVVQQELNRVAAAIPTAKSVPACLDLYRQLTQKLLPQWYITVENDFLVMTTFGWLRRLVPNEEHLLPHLHFDSVSAQQVTVLAKLSHSVFDNPLRVKLYQEEKYQTLLQGLADDVQLARQIESYLRVYGGRFANELKLESPDITDDKKHLLDMLFRYHESQVVSQLESNRYSSGYFLSDLLVNRLLSQFRKRAAKREDLRLLRSKAFSLVRQIFRRTGEHLVTSGQLRAADDIFFLSIDQIHAGNQTDLASVVAIEKRTFDYYRTLTLSTHCASIGARPALVDVLADTSVVPSGGSVLHGRGCTIGTVTGTVTVFEDFALPRTESIDIIVARHTDPGWTPLIGLAKGMIIEAGGLLSHASIVARELGIPTVIGVRGALELLQTGQTVTLNGRDGTVLIHDDNPVLQ